MRVQRILRWDRSDQYALEITLWLVPFLGALALLGPLRNALRGGPLAVSAPLPESVVRAAGVRDVTGTVTLPDAALGQHLLAMLPLALTILLVTVAVVLLLGVARGLRRGDPFQPANVTRLRLLGLLIALGGIGAQWVRDTTRNTLLDGVALAGYAMPIALEIQLWPVLAGALVAFLSEVYARGARLRDDVEGMV